MLKFQGKVTDLNGNPVPGAQLTITKTNVITPLPIIFTIASDGSIVASANPFNSDSNGEYVFAVEPGSYSIEATGSSAVLNISKTITQFTPSDPASAASTVARYCRTLNPFFYDSLSPWATSGGVPPVYTALHSRVTGTGCCQQGITTPTPSSTATATGSISQTFNLPASSNSTTLNFYSSIRTSNVIDDYSGYVKVYLYVGETGLEVLLGTFTHTVAASKQVNNVWELRTLDLSSYTAAGGAFVLRLEISATATDTGGVVTVFTAIAVDDVYILA